MVFQMIWDQAEKLMDNRKKFCFASATLAFLILIKLTLPAQNEY